MDVVVSHGSINCQQSAAESCQPQQHPGCMILPDFKSSHVHEKRLILQHQHQGIAHQGQQHASSPLDLAQSSPGCQIRKPNHATGLPTFSVCYCKRLMLTCEAHSRGGMYYRARDPFKHCKCQAENFCLQLAVSWMTFYCLMWDVLKLGQENK